MARKPSEVKVRRPDPVTGEVVEEVVPADRFAPLAAKPKDAPAAKMQRDPLAGHREAINNGKGTCIFLPDPRGKSKCPVEIGEVFKLRSCGIEITRKQRVRHKGRPCWRVEFARIGKPAKPYLLKRGGGYTHDPDLAMRSQDDAQAAGTLDAIHPEGRSEAHRGAGEPPEPEGVPPSEVADLKKSMEARLKHRGEQREGRLEQNARVDAKRISRKLHRLQIEAGRYGIDLTPRIVAMLREAQQEIAQARVPTRRAVGI